MINRMIAKNLVERAASLGPDEGRVVDVLLNEDSPWRNVRRGEFGFNIRALERHLGWGAKRVRTACIRIREALR